MGDSDDDTPLLDEFKERCRKLYETEGRHSSARMTLAIRCQNGKQYELPMRIEISKPSNGKNEFRIEAVGQGCIGIRYREGEKDPDPLSTVIHANTEKEACFRPRLTSDPPTAAAADRILTTDVLQVVKTKLCFVLPFPLVNGISMFDMMTVQGVAMTPFRMMRGGMPYYWKYGYRNEETIPFRTYLMGLTMKAVRQVEEDILSGRVENPEFNGLPPKDWVGPFTVLKNALDVKGIPSSDDERLTDVMANFSFEDEQTAFKNLSKTVLSLLETTNMFMLNTHVLDPTTPEWKEWRKKVVITGVTFFPTAEERRKKKKTRRRLAAAVAAATAAPALTPLTNEKATPKGGKRRTHRRKSA